MAPPFGLGGVSNSAVGVAGPAFPAAASPGATGGLANTAETYMRSGIPGASFGLANTAETYMGSGWPGAVWQSGATGSLPAFGVPGSTAPNASTGSGQFTFGGPGFAQAQGGMGRTQMTTGMPAGMAGYAGLPFDYAGFGYGGLGSQLAGEEGNLAGGQAVNNFSTASGQGNDNSMTTSGSGSSPGSSSGGSSGSASGASRVAGGYGTPAGYGSAGGSATGGGGSANQGSSGYGNSSGGVQRTARLEQNRRGGDHFLADVLSANGLPNADGSLHWPLGLLGLPDASGDTLRRQVDTALTMAADRQDRGETSAGVLRKVRPALRRLQRMLYEKEGEIPEQEYQECTQFLRKLSRAVRDLE
jgi:hypothetical protein